MTTPPQAYHAQRALPLWGFSPQSACTLLAHSENFVFHVAPEQTKGTAPSYVLRLHRPQYHSEQAIASEIQWLLALSHTGVAVPRPIIGLDGSFVQVFDTQVPIFATMLAYLPGKSGETIPATEELYEKIGAITARFHSHASAWQFPAGFTRPIWGFSECLGPQARWGDWRVAIPKGLQTSLPLVEQAVAQVRVRLEKYGKTRENSGLIHSDIRVANVLENNGNLAVIDFDDASFGWFMFDCASSFSFCEDSPHLAEWVAAWLRGYRTARGGRFPTLADEDIIPCFVIMRRLSLLAWKGTRKKHPPEDISFAETTVELVWRFLHRQLL